VEAARCRGEEGCAVGRSRGGDAELRTTEHGTVTLKTLRTEQSRRRSASCALARAPGDALERVGWLLAAEEKEGGGLARLGLHGCRF
jgi:hypothetical protein